MVSLVVAVSMRRMQLQLQQKQLATPFVTVFRSVATGWGTPDVGGSYTMSPTWLGLCRQPGGHMTLSPGRSVEATVKGLRINDVNAGADFGTESAIAGTLYQELRVRKSGEQSYGLRLKQTAAGAQTLAIVRSGPTAGTLTTLIRKELPAAAEVGSWTSVEVEASGTTPVLVRARAWASGAPRA